MVEETKAGIDFLIESRRVTEGATKINYLKRSKEISGEYMAQYYQEAWEAKRSGKTKVCWVTVPFPSSLMYTFDIHVFEPELDGVFAGFMGEAVKWQLHAENKGYSRDLCSYARVNLGRIFAGAGEAEGAMPPPDFLVTARMNCTTYIHWWEMLSRHFNIPLFILDGPFCDRPRHEPIAKHHEEYWIKRSYDLIAFLEEQTGQKFDRDRYMENIGYEREARVLWDEIGKYSQRVPSPVNEFDLLFPMMPICWWRGKKLAVDVYKEVKAELQERVDKGITALVKEERHRLMLVSNPPWFRLEMLPQWLAEVDSVFVVSMINRMFVDYADVGEGNFEDTLRGFYRQYINLDIEERIKWGEELIRDWKCDAMALMDNRGCKPIAFPIPEMAMELEKRLKIPCLRFEGNMNDPRDFNDQKVRAQFETFIP
jgi:benzoyl-CoA reductase/2-hydroxyglutaryl-CoA dehydratase subunit BcrC/BadD/HgdB